MLVTGLPRTYLSNKINGDTLGTEIPGGFYIENVQELISNKSILYKFLEVGEQTDYPVSPFLTLPCI